MFLSLTRKVVYAISSLLLASILIFTIAFYESYSSKIEQDLQMTIQRNSQYVDLLYRNISLSKELKQLLEEKKDIKIDFLAYKHINALLNDTALSDILTAEQKNIVERSKNFDEQYKTISNGLTTILIGAVLLAFCIMFIGYLISRWVLAPINKISTISAEVSHGNLNLRIPLEHKIKHPDELDILSQTFNQMLDNLQNIISEIKDKENFLQALIDSIPDGIRVIDENYNIIIANKSYYKQTGTSPESSKKCYMSAFGISLPCTAAHQKCPLHELINNKKQNINIIQQFAHNPHCHLAVNAARLNYGNNCRYIVESIRDLSRDIDFSHQQKLSSLGFLSSSIAHEIKNHLGALRMIIEHLIDKYYQEIPDDNDEKKMILMIHNELVNAINVPERLLKLTRTSGAAETVFNSSAAISDVLNLLDYEAKSKGIDICFKAPKQPLELQGNETDFKIAIINIVLNAIKAMSDKGILNIKLSASKTSGIKMSFADNGIGIAKENLNNIFMPFFSDGRQNQNSSGSGLGLAITKSIVEKFGGSIEVSSELGKGSCFTLSFPDNKKLAKK